MEQQTGAKPGISRVRRGWGSKGMGKYKSMRTAVDGKSEERGLSPSWGEIKGGRVEERGSRSWGEIKGGEWRKGA